MFMNEFIRFLLKDNAKHVNTTLHTDIMYSQYASDTPSLPMNGPNQQCFQTYSSHMKFYGIICLYRHNTCYTVKLR